MGRGSCFLGSLCLFVFCGNALLSATDVVIIGGNRGIGYEFAKQYVEAGCQVVATYRNEKTALNALQELHPQALFLYPLEVTDPEAIEQFSKTVGNVDLLIINAGIKGYPVAFTRPPANTGLELKAALEVNTIAADNIIRAFYPRLSQREDACIVYMGSRVGQIADNSSGGSHPYRISKAAAHGLIWNWNIELMLEWKRNHSNNLLHAPCAIAICPGWVRTDMGGPHARLSAHESVCQMRGVIEHVRETKASNGLYMYDGSIAESYATPPILEEILDAKKIKAK